MSDVDFKSMTPEQIAEYQRQNCIFCKIIKGEIPARKPYEDSKVVCVMDIYPAAKGHLLMMTKEHYPILPAVPQDLAAHMFKITKGMSKAVKSALVTDRSTIFVANGAIAGQQSPHFLYHIIPRENGDGLDQFILPSKELPEGAAEKILLPMKQRIAAFVAASRPKPAVAVQPDSPVAQKVLSSPEQQHMINDTGSEERFAYLAKMLQESPDMQALLAKDPAGFMKELDQYPDVKAMFAGIDLVKLSEALKKINEVTGK